MTNTHKKEGRTPAAMRPSFSHTRATNGTAQRDCGASRNPAFQITGKAAPDAGD